MVVLTIVIQKNGKTIYFEDSILKVHFMKLISYSLFNSWDTLEKEGSATLDNNKEPEGKSVVKILPGHYDLESLAKEIEVLFRENHYPLETEINQPVGQLVIKNSRGKQVELDSNLSNLLGIRQKLSFTTFVKRLTSPTTYLFIAI